jgi:muramoyltetrapeptide carboxypeptidase
VRPGDRVGVAALSGACDPDALARGMAALRGLGFEPVPARNLGSRWGIFAGDDAERVDAFHELVADDSLAAIVFARGGYGLHRVLPSIDWELVGRRPRAWLGYSDVTPFLLQVVERLGVVTFHAPMVATDLARGLRPEEATSLLAALAGEGPFVYSVRSLRAGSAEGRVEGVVLGGCLSLVAAVLGTPWATSLDGALLFLEDVNEPLHRVDRMLTHLRLSGRLTGVRGMIFGYFGPDWEQAIGEIPSENGGRWHRETLLALPGPVAWGAPCGHGIPNLTLPLGARGCLDPDADLLEISAT